MDNPELWRNSEILKAEMRNFFLENKAKISLRADGKDSLLDIGCAGGNSTVDVICPILLSGSFSRVVGVDINRKMIAYANEHFQRPNISFDVLDVGADLMNVPTAHECFDHITCALCLDLVPDQQQAMKNIYNLLQRNGDCLLYIIVNCSVFDTYGKMLKNWSKYTYDADDFISPYHRCVSPEYLLEKYLKNAGFARYDIQMMNETMRFNDINEFKESYQSVIPFLHRMSAAEQEEFMDEFVDRALVDGETMQKNDDGVGIEINIPYSIMTAFAKK